MQINPYLNFNGNCGEAMRFYAEVLGGKDLRVMTFRDSAMAEQVAANEKDMVIHARFKVGDFTIMGSDAPGGRYNKPRGHAVSIGVATPEEAEMSACRSPRPSGPNASAWSPTGSARRGWSTAKSRCNDA
jgi:PhnB protein